MQIAEQGLTPDIAIRACNNPRITSSILSREIGKVVAERAEAEIARRRIKRKAEAASGLASFARGGGATKDATGGEQQRPRRHSEGVARTVTPHPNETHNAAASAGSILPPVRFTAPYLKGRPTHFERKLGNYVASSLASSSTPSPAKAMPAAAVVVRTRKTSGQQNAVWQNQKSYAKDVGERLKMATKEATQKFVSLSSGKLTGTQQGIIDNLNKKYMLHGNGRDGSREKHILGVRTVQRLVAKEQVGVTPQKRGPKPKISREFIHLVALHINMEQIGVHGEMSTAQIKATLTAATLDTVHEGKFNDEYAWMQVRRIHADILVPTGIVQAEDIRWQWVTYEKVAQFYQDHRVSLSLHLLYSPTSIALN